MIEFLIILVCLSSVAWTIAFGRGNAMFRALLIVCLLVCSLYVFEEIRAYRGLPREVKESPQELLVYGSHVSKDESTIYILCDGDGEPLSIAIPYSKSMHKALVRGAAMAKGDSFTMQMKGDPFPSDSLSLGEEKGSISEASEPTFIVSLPSSQMPSK